MTTKVQKQSHREKVADDPAAQDLVETPATDTGHDRTATSQADELRAYAPAVRQWLLAALRMRRVTRRTKAMRMSPFEAEDGSGSIADAMRDNLRKTSSMRR